MMFISIEDSDGDTVWINPEQVVSASDREEGGSTITMANGGFIDVNDTADEITDYIIEQMNEKKTINKPLTET